MKITFCWQHRFVDSVDWHTPVAALDASVGPYTGEDLEKVVAGLLHDSFDEIVQSFGEQTFAEYRVANYDRSWSWMSLIVENSDQLEVAEIYRTVVGWPSMLT